MTLRQYIIEIEDFGKDTAFDDRYNVTVQESVGSDIVFDKADNNLSTALNATHAYILKSHKEQE